MSHKAVFLDRDDTVLNDPGYLSDPAGVELLPGVDQAIIDLRNAGYKIVLVTNQSGIARGMFDEAMLEKIHSELRRQLVNRGAILDAIFYCPFHPEGKVEKYAKESDLRKPGPGMLHQAAEQLNIDLSQSWMVGDSERDVEAGKRAGCEKTVLLTGTDDTDKKSQADFIVKDLLAASRIILRGQNETSTQNGPEVLATADSEEGLIAMLGNFKSDSETEKKTAEQAPPVGASEPIKTLPVDVIPRGEDAPVPPKLPAEKSEPRSEQSSNDTEIRKEILRYVRQLSKADDVQEFSLANMLGGLAQMLAIMFLGLVAWTSLKGQPVNEAILYALVAIVFQAMSLTFFTMSKRSR